MRRLCSAIIIIAVFSTFINGAKSPLEQKLFKNYDPKHRPVKQDSTTTQVAVYLSIGHIEKVDEYEQTMLVHGYLWATWTDEYLNWTPAENNNVTMLQIDSWQIWQPALALYNSARGNSWHLYMHGLPSTVFSSGKVWASGSFSFFVTCQFDFSEWPYDTQSCPIVIADWVYDLSRVNLSDPSGKPAVRLSYDPLGDANAKKHEYQKKF
ncbi:unnamed protein product [Caenorhabditis auriculariae]|uniref:Neurotransmitter-gated ion-channel ligand-binding domain-containing protein n=1 Tax=Caenorhabditis auriculariae TaxID=2777116 RepID=A0A8S1H8H0_9PELO|nr:unnamed protein product [Caenorhabditis auriculariae]